MTFGGLPTGFKAKGISESVMRGGIANDILTEVTTMFWSGTVFDRLCGFESKLMSADQGRICREVGISALSRDVRASNGHLASKIAVLGSMRSLPAS